MKAAILIICLAASISVAAADREYRYQYLGCYKDADQRDLGEKQWQDGRMTQRRCINFCGENGFSYAGAQYGGQCFCGNSYGRYGKLAENNCNVPCNGDSGRHCGGTWANSMFKISDTSMPGGPPARTTSSATYLGCYKDADQRDLNERHWEDGRMTQDRCISSCRENGFAYAAVQYGGHCFCGNAYGKYGKIAESNCNMSCSGDSSHHCGGTWANSIFEISNGPKLSDERYMPTEGAASGSAGAITTDAIVEVEDSNGPIKLKAEEKIAIMFLTAIQNIESDCQMRAKHACTMDQLLAGPVASDGAHLAHLKFDPATDPNYTYSLTASGMAWEAHANARKPGLAGFYFLSKAFPSADATYNPAGTASAIDKQLTGRSVGGDSFAVR